MYLDNKWRKLSLYRVLNRLYVNKLEVIFNGRSVYVDASYEVIVNL